MNATPGSSSAAEGPLEGADRPRVEDVVRATVTFSELHGHGGRLVWVRTDAEGCPRAWQAGPDGPMPLTPAGRAVRSRVYEYGGGALCLTDDGLVCVLEPDQQPYFIPAPIPGGPLPAPQRMLHRSDCRYGGLVWDGLRQRVIAVEEQDGWQHRLVAVTRTGERQVLAEGADFYSSPALCPFGRQLAWIEWDRPCQPWTQARLRHVQLDAAGRPAVMLPGLHHPDSSPQQPCFDRRGRLACLWDRSGHWRPWVLEQGVWQGPLGPEADHMPTAWVLGRRHLAAAPGSGWLTCFMTADGMDWAHCEVSGWTRLPPTGGHFHGALAATADRVATLVQGATLLPQVMQGPAEGPLQVLDAAPNPWASGPLSCPQPVCEGGIPGWFHAPCGGSADALPPLLVQVHGGPTSASHPLLDPRVQFWTRRGWAVLDVNYRGSTGQGRAWRQQLAGGWGELDVEDVLALTESLVRQGRVDPRRLFLRGQSAGGFTVLNALIRAPGRFRAGASLFGVTDPLVLRTRTHKFEADYLDWLIGEPDRHPQRYRRRSPCRQVERLTTPVIFFQGEQDRIVDPDQTRRMVAALQALGRPVEAVFLPQAGHGFHRPQDQALVLQREWDFYQRCLERKDT